MEKVDTDCKQGEMVIATVGDRAISVEDLFAYLRFSFNWNIVNGLVEQTLVEQALDEYEVEAEDEEIAAYADSFRAKHGLLSVKDTEQWLQSAGMTAENFYDSCEFAVRQNKLRDRLFSDETVRQRFVMSRGDYESVELYEIVVQKESKAKEIAALIQDGKSFFELAKQYSEDEATRKLCGYIGPQIRSQLRPELESRIYAAKEGDVIGPIKSVGYHHLVFIEKFHLPELTHAIQEEIRNALYATWKKERLDTASIDLLL